MTVPADDPYYGVRLSLMQIINRDRAFAGAPPVEFDALASSVGDRHCQEMAAYNYLSHWDLRGLLGYHRYHLAGGRDHVQENLSRISVTSSNPFPIGTRPADLLPLLTESHARYMAERPPMDGHRKVVLDPSHTHVGIGLAVVGPEFRMAELYVNRYVRLVELPPTLPPGAIRIEGQMLRPDYGPYYCVLFHEPAPQRRTTAELDRTYSYNDTEGDQCGASTPWKMSFDPSRGSFHFSIPARDCGPGIYHLLLWVRRDIRTIPYQLKMGANKINTHDVVPAAGWIFVKA